MSRQFYPLIPAMAILLSANSLAFELADTGQSNCSTDDVGGVADCALVPSPYYRQDGRFGYDAAAKAGLSNKVGAGASGFDYTKLDQNGAALNIQTQTYDENAWQCVQDNITGLMWEVHTDNFSLHHGDWHYTETLDTAFGVLGDFCFDPARCDTASFVVDVNIATLCGFNDWRLPTRSELFSIVQFGTISSGIDLDYFPNTFMPAPSSISFYYTADIELNSPFRIGKDIINSDPDNQGSVRLVREN